MLDLPKLFNKNEIKLLNKIHACKDRKREADKKKATERATRGEKERI